MVNEINKNIWESWITLQQRELVLLQKLYFMKSENGISISQPIKNKDGMFSWTNKKSKRSVWFKWDYNQSFVMGYSDNGEWDEIVEPITMQIVSKMRWVLEYVEQY